MHICYVDESGNDQLLTSREAPPVLVIAGVVVAEANLTQLTWDFLRLKLAYNPQLGAPGKRLTDSIRTEVKGADLRADIRSSSRRRDRRAFGFLDAVLSLLEGHNAAVHGQVWVKQNGEGVPQAFYPTAIAEMAAHFHSQLAAGASQGIMILDARTKSKNVPSVHGITTRRFRSGGDQLPRLVESPVFGHSDAHVVLQLVDIVASALLFPMACANYCKDLEDNVHAAPEYQAIRSRYGQRLRDMEYRYTDAEGKRCGGFRVFDKRNHQGARELFVDANDLGGSRDAPRQRTRTRRRGGVEVSSSRPPDAHAVEENPTAEHLRGWQPDP